MLWTTAAIFVGFLLDLCFGDPNWMPHPIRFIGMLIAQGEKLLRRIFLKSVGGERIAGGILALLVPVLCFGISLGILYLAGLVHPVLRFVVESLFCYQILATKSLKTESMKVYHKLKAHDLAGARVAVSMIVGRDTAHLSEEEVAKAAVETVAENTSDGIVAPLLFLLFGGAPLGFFYKAVNTLDSMIGYKNEKYLHFGLVAAKFDDLCNWIPARLSAWVMILAARVVGLDAVNAKRIYLRDHSKHASPNSAHTEAVCAGALHIQLAGDAVYFGELHQKQTIGDPDREIRPFDIKQANRLLYGTAILTVIAVEILRMGAFLVEKFIFV